MMALRADQDATHDLLDAWRGMQQLHQTIASQTSRRATASGSDAEAILREQVQTIATLRARHLAARATAALARTEQSAVGGRAPSNAGRQRARELAEEALALSPESPDAHAVLGDLLIDALDPERAETEFRQALNGPGLEHQPNKTRRGTSTARQVHRGRDRAARGATTRAGGGARAQRARTGAAGREKSGGIRGGVS